MRTALLGEICELKYGKSLPEKMRIQGKVPVYGSNGCVGSHDDAITNGQTIIIGRKGSIGEINFSEVACWPIDTTYFIDRSCTAEAIRWLAYALRDLGLSELNKATGVPGLNRNDAYAKSLLVPPLDEQKRIAAILDQAEHLRQLRHRTVDRLNELGQVIFDEMFNGETCFTRMALGEVANLKRGPFGGALKKEIFADHGYKVYEQGHVIQQDWTIDRYFIDECKFREMNDFSVLPHDLLVTCSGTLGRVYMLPANAGPGVINQALLRVRPKEERVTPLYLRHFLASRTVQAELTGISHGTGLQNFPPMNDVKALQVMVPPLLLQHAFADHITAVSTCVTSQSASLAKLNTLFASLQHRAFRGEL
jgi:type I restriction enzyme S subunit